MHDQVSIQPLLDIPQAAAIMGIPPTTLRDMVTQRRVPHTRIGKHVRFSAEHLAEIIRTGERPVAKGHSSMRPTGRRGRAIARVEV
jgi:excisionase family DNA binding protein